MDDLSSALSLPELESYERCCVLTKIHCVHSRSPNNYPQNFSEVKETEISSYFLKVSALFSLESGGEIPSVKIYCSGRLFYNESFLIVQPLNNLFFFFFFFYPNWI